jgi:hypothetical protein
MAIATMAVDFVVQAFTCRHNSWPM